mmetsp:Transcript_27798/g.66200  ORF Transcript_27798/g.66200 Transcript_27798/m.66200 type:complete len:200 (+) Transcript_27798:214-813(+)
MPDATLRTLPYMSVLVMKDRGCMCADAVEVVQSAGSGLSSWAKRRLGMTLSGCGMFCMNPVLHSWPPFLGGATSAAVRSLCRPWMYERCVVERLSTARGFVRPRSTVLMERDKPLRAAVVLLWSTGCISIGIFIVSRYVDDVGTVPGCSQGCGLPGSFSFQPERTVSVRKLVDVGGPRSCCCRTWMERGCGRALWKVVE